MNECEIQGTKTLVADVRLLDILSYDECTREDERFQVTGMRTSRGYEPWDITLEVEYPDHSDAVMNCDAESYFYKWGPADE